MHFHYQSNNFILGPSSPFVRRSFEIKIKARYFGFTGENHLKENSEIPNIFEEKPYFIGTCSESKYINLLFAAIRV